MVVPVPNQGAAPIMLATYNYPLLDILWTMIEFFLFFLWIWPNLYPAFGYLDLSLTIIQAPLLALALYQQSKYDM